MRVTFDDTGAAPQLGFDLPSSLRLYASDDAGIPEALKGNPPTLINGKRNGITVPAGARWIYLHGNDAEDLEGECLDLTEFKRFAEYTIKEAGWLDYNHMSRPQRIPKEWLEAGMTTQDFKIGKITGLRFSGRNWYAEGYLWPQGQNRHADTMWTQIKACPESIHTSPGGPVIGRENCITPEGRPAKRLKMLVNHIALCDVACNPHGTGVSLEPNSGFEEATKSLSLDLPSYTDIPAGLLSEALKGLDCKGKPRNSLESYLLADGDEGEDEDAEGAKSTMTSASISAGGGTREDLEGARAYLGANGESFKSVQHTALYLVSRGLPPTMATAIAVGDPMNEENNKVDDVIRRLQQATEAHKMAPPGAAPPPAAMAGAPGGPMPGAGDDEEHEEPDGDEGMPPAPGGEEASKAAVRLDHTLLQRFIQQAVAAALPEALKSALAPVTQSLAGLNRLAGAIAEAQTESLKTLDRMPGVRSAGGRAVSTSAPADLDQAGRVRKAAADSMGPNKLARALNQGEALKCVQADIGLKPEHANYLTQGILPLGIDRNKIAAALGVQSI